MRYEIGIDNMLWGNDFPHPEGTWPNTHEWLRKTFHDIPIDETRRMLGLAAAEVFGFDVEALRAHRRQGRPDARPTSVSSPTTPTGADLDARWAPVKDVGRHWLTGHEFPFGV